MFPKRLIPGNYGKVADHLKDAAKQLQAGDKPNAAQALASAAKDWKAHAANGRCSRTRCHTR